LGLLAIGDLLCGFAKSATMLFVFRALAGVGAGGINSIAMIIVSDVTTLQNRGYYQGILGAVIAMANGIGPFIGGVLVEKASWRWVFWIVPPLTVPAMVVILLFLPLKHHHEGIMDKIRKIDFAGVGLNIAAVLLILVSIPALAIRVLKLTDIQIPLSGAGTTYAWDSAFFIAMITVGGLLAITFVLYEWKLAKIPIMPREYPCHFQSLG
jgi:MFS family permease